MKLRHVVEKILFLVSPSSSCSLYIPNPVLLTDVASRCGLYFFVVSGKKGSFTALGVADGVGAWKAKGIDPSLLPRRLMEACKSYLQTPTPALVATDDGLIVKVHADMQTTLQRAFDNVKKQAPGSTTACLVAIGASANESGDNDSPFINVCNLGDSGAGLYRPSTLNNSATLETIWRSPFQVHEHAHGLNQAPPYQLASIPDHLNTPLVVQDAPTDALVYTLPAQVGDILLLATDGFWENMTPVDKNLAKSLHAGMNLPPTPLAYLIPFSHSDFFSSLIG